MIKSALRKQDDTARDFAGNQTEWKTMNMFLTKNTSAARHLATLAIGVAALALSAPTQAQQSQCSGCIAPVYSNQPAPVSVPQGYNFSLTGRGDVGAIGRGGFIGQTGYGFTEAEGGTNVVLNLAGNGCTVNCGTGRVTVDANQRIMTGAGATESRSGHMAQVDTIGSAIARGTIGAISAPLVHSAPAAHQPQ